MGGDDPITMFARLSRPRPSGPTIIARRAVLRGLRPGRRPRPTRRIRPNPLAGQRQFLNCDEAHQANQAWRPWQARL